MQCVHGAETSLGLPTPNVLSLASGSSETKPELQAFYSILSGLYKNILFRKINSSCLHCGGLDSLELKSSQSWGLQVS